MSSAVLVWYHNVRKRSHTIQNILNFIIREQNQKNNPHITTEYIPKNVKQTIKKLLTILTYNSIRCSIHSNKTSSISA